MSMGDKSYCVTPCKRKDCERNIKYNPPEQELVWMTTFDNDNPDPMHKGCAWKIKKRK